MNNSEYICSLARGCEWTSTYVYLGTAEIRKDISLCHLSTGHLRNLSEAVEKENKNRKNS